MAKETTIAVRLDALTSADLEALRLQLERENPGVGFNTSNAARAALTEGLKRLLKEKEKKGRR